MRRRLAFIFGLAILVMSSMSNLSASVAVRMPLEDLVRNSSAVVRAKVIRSEGFKDDTSGRIYTRHTVAVSEYWRGTGPFLVNVTTIGGEVGDLGQLVPGEATLAVDEDVVLCLQKGRLGFAVVGMAQGKFRVEKRPKVTALVRDLGGLLLVGEESTNPGGPAPHLEELDLDRFKAMVRAVKQ